MLEFTEKENEEKEITLIYMHVSMQWEGLVEAYDEQEL